MQGFGIGESATQVKRRRFRLLRNPEYQLLQYIILPNDPSTVPIQIGLMKVRPRMANTLPQHPTPNSVRPMVAGMQMPIQRNMVPAQQQQQQQQKPAVLQGACHCFLIMSAFYRN